MSLKTLDFVVGVAFVVVVGFGGGGVCGWLVGLFICFLFWRRCWFCHWFRVGRIVVPV